MFNNYLTRLTLTGPSDAVARFVDTCVRVRLADEAGAAPSLDLGTIVPVPAEIRAPFEGGIDEPLTVAHVAIAYENWLAWIGPRWGTTSNADDFDGRMIGDIYDCCFTCAGGCPVAVMLALAADYPELRGTVVSGGPDDDWSLVAAFRDGRFSSVTYPYDPRMQALADAGQWLGTTASASARALLSVAEDSDLDTGLHADERLWDRAILATHDIGGDLLKSFVFKHVVDEACGIFETEGEQALIDSDLARWPESIAHVGFLLEDGRLRTEVDRWMLRASARMLYVEAMVAAGCVDRSRFEEELSLEQVDLPAGDELWEWAGRAMYREGAAFGFTDEGLQAGLVDYGAQLRVEILDHLDGTLMTDRLDAAA